MTKQRSFSLEHIVFEGTPASFRKPKQCHGQTSENEYAGRTAAFEHEPLHAFIAWALESTGLSADAYRAAPLHRRLKACLRALKVESVSETWALMHNPESVEKVLDSLLIGVTEFFRDEAVFNALRKNIESNMPFRQAPVRIWSAGCSNGAELYSLAILLIEAGLYDHSILVGTDCRAAAIQDARAGLYNAGSVQSMDVLLRQKYMQNTGAQWQVIGSLRRHVQWRVRNLLSGVENGPWDIILWRNMAIYLKPDSVLRIWDALIKELRPGGFLVVGRAEQPPSSAGLTCISRGIYQLPGQVTDLVGS